MIKQALRTFFRKLGVDVIRYNPDQLVLPSDFEARNVELIEKILPYTITSPERIYALIESVRYVLRNGVPGAFLECGVYKGGSMMAVALTLMEEGVTDRDLYLFDTFEGMPAPSEVDVDLWGTRASDTYSKHKISEVSSTWANASLASVQEALSLTGYPMDKIHFVKGLVEETLPEKAPEEIALIRLDTDWYHSTMHELNHLYPNLSPKGILLVDDYGHYQGAKKAVDEYFVQHGLNPFLHRIDYTARLVIKDP